MTSYLRGQIAKMANVNIETIRYYENCGLIPPPTRTASGYRLYSEEVMDRLSFIRNAKRCGFKLKEIHKALTHSGENGMSIADFVGAIDKKIEAIDTEMAKLARTKSSLAFLKANLQAQEKHPDVQQTLRALFIDS